MGSGLETSRELLCNANLASLSDEDLMEHLRGGNSDALAELFTRFHRLVLNIALRTLHDAGEAEDLTQSVFLEIFRSASRFDPVKGTAKIWILQYAYHRSLNRRRYLRLRGLYCQPQQFNPITAPKPQQHKRYFDGIESGGAMREALSRLNTTQRKTLELVFYDGLAFDEIAQTTGVSFHSVKHNYYRGLRKLRSILSDVAVSSVSREVDLERGKWNTEA